MENKLKFRNYLGYGLGDTAFNIAFQTVALYLLFFYTDIFGISPIAAGILFVVARVWDAVNDPIMGVIADKTNTRFGKFRPYLFFGAIPFGILTALLFFSPDFSQTGKLVYAYVTYIGFGMIYTALNIPYGAITSVMTQEMREREKLTFFRQSIGALSGGIFAAVAFKPLAEYFGTAAGDIAKGYQQAIIVFAALTTILLLICFFNTKEVVKPVKKENVSLKSSFKMLKENKPLKLLLINFVLTFTRNTIVGAVGLYYFKYILERADLFPIFIMVTLVPTLIMLPFILKIIKRFGKKKVALAALISSTIVSLIVFVMPANFYLFLGISLIGGVFASPFGVVQWSLVPETVEYGQWKSGVRVEGFIYSIVGFAFKLGMAAGGLIPGVILSLTGYVPDVAQTPLALWGIRILIGLIPAILTFMGFMSFRKYSLTEDKYLKIAEELKTNNIES